MSFALPSSTPGWVALALAYGPLINLLVLSVGLIFTWRQFRNARIVREQQNFSAILARSSDINTRTEASHYRRIAADCFTNVTDRCPASALGPIDDEEAYKFYWGSRSYFLDVIILILQVWLLANQPSHLRGGFAGWEVIAKAVSREIRGLTYAGKPSWYIKACDDVCRYMHEGRVYPPKFVKYMESLARE
jgi:hypothetical protein